MGEEIGVIVILWAIGATVSGLMALHLRTSDFKIEEGKTFELNGAIYRCEKLQELGK